MFPPPQKKYKIKNSMQTYSTGSVIEDQIRAPAIQAISHVPLILGRKCGGKVMWLRLFRLEPSFSSLLRFFVKMFLDTFE